MHSERVDASKLEPSHLWTLIKRVLAGSVTVPKKYRNPDTYHPSIRKKSSIRRSIRTKFGFPIEKSKNPENVFGINPEEG
jgi:hypothetical protein